VLPRGTLWFSPPVLRKAVAGLTDTRARVGKLHRDTITAIVSTAAPTSTSQANGSRRGEIDNPVPSLSIASRNYRGIALAWYSAGTRIFLPRDDALCFFVLFFFLNIFCHMMHVSLLCLC